MCKIRYITGSLEVLGALLLIVTLVPDADFLADVQRSRMTSLQIGGVAVVLALAALLQYLRSAADGG